MPGTVMVDWEQRCERLLKWCWLQRCEKWGWAEGRREDIESVPEKFFGIGDIFYNMIYTPKCPRVMRQIRSILWEMGYSYVPDGTHEYGRGGSVALCYVRDWAVKYEI